MIDDQLLDDDELLAVKEVRLAYESVKVVDCLDLSKDGSDAWEAALKRFIASSNHCCCVYNQRQHKITFHIKSQ